MVVESGILGTMRHQHIGIGGQGEREKRKIDAGSRGATNIK
jgi:hypothetical protein